MKDLDVNSLVVVETLPKIMEQLDVLGEYIDNGLKDIDKLDCTEENKQFVKKKKAEINNTLKILEDKRKEIKNKILEPYNVFNNKFEDVAKIKLENASTLLSKKINEIEYEQKLKKEELLREFANRQFIANEIQDVVKFEDIGLNITLSASEKSLKEQIVQFCERIRNDLDTILLEELKDEIFMEYKKCLNYTQAKQIVLQRQKDLEQAKIQNDNIKAQSENAKKLQSAVYEVIKDELDDIKAPEQIIEDNEIIKVEFKVKGTRTQLRNLKQFLNAEGIEYE